MRSKPHPYTEAISSQSRFPNDYWSALNWLWVWGSNDYSFRLRTNSSSYMKPLLNRVQTTIAVALPSLLLLHTPSDCQAIPSREDRSCLHDNAKRPRRQCIGIRSALTLEPKNKKNEATRKRFRRIRYTLRLTSDHLVLLPQKYTKRLTWASCLRVLPSI